MPRQSNQSEAEYLEGCSDNMEIYPSLLARLVLFCFVLGAVVGVWCDVFRLACSNLKFKAAWRRAARFFGDLVAVIFCILGVIILCYYFNRGTVRAFCFLGTLGGFFVYRYTISYPICAVLRFTARTIFNVIRVFLIPIVKIFKICIKFLKKIKDYISKTLEKIISLVYNDIKYNYILNKAKNGFLQDK
jgi:hypothetical protein